MSKEKQIDDMTLAVLSCYRNKYYADGNSTEQGIIANAINDVLPALVSLREENYRKQSEGEGFMLTFDGTTEYFNKDVVIYAVKAYMRRNRWIPVTEALPEEGCASVVAVIYRDNPLQDWECVVTAAYFVPINGKIDGMWVLLDDEKKIESKEIHITHWVPLPEAPKMKGGRNDGL